MLAGRGSWFGAAGALALALVAGGALAIGASGDTALISRESASAGGDGANGAPGAPSVSGDGRFTAFATEATNLGGAIAATRNVYVTSVSAARRGGPGSGTALGGATTLRA
jgi:hypothetical protein